MQSSPLEDAVAAQFSHFCYPDPRIPVEMRRPWNDPSIYGAVYWPDHPDRSDGQFLVAGCGTSEAVALAIRNPSAQIWAIDVSEPSIKAQQELANRMGIGNITLKHLPIERAEELGQNFDFISAGGVLHHLASPLEGLRVLGRLLKEDGVIAAAVYSHCARVGLDMLREAFKTLDLKQDDSGIALVRSALATLKPTNPAASWLTMTGEQGQMDSHLVDSFLPARERDFTVAELLDWVEEADLQFQGWLENAPYHIDSLLPPENPLFQTLSRLEDRRHWSVMERLNPTPDHCFIACKKSRDLAHYALDFQSPRLLSAIPGRRYPTTERYPTLPYDPRNPLHDAIYRLIDGQTPFSGILDRLQTDSPRPQIEALARAFLRHLWRKDAVFFRFEA